MGQPSHPASNAIIYLSYGAFLYVEKTILPVSLYSVVADLLPESSDATSHGDFDIKQRTQTGQGFFPRCFFTVELIGISRPRAPE
ncbi:hypothetical protein LARI1_G002785 [Lachnellula arida]|uniref:Uncharacterized protein n=1 Tax=Lachnellula arida TaxID=1316785 RepID=A0A8T9BHW2_9HELO|nr:hypothetical protein LARI1_G002785 [Lachnellula arida]